MVPFPASSHCVSLHRCFKAVWVSCWSRSFKLCVIGLFSLRFARQARSSAQRNVSVLCVCGEVCEAECVDVCLRVCKDIQPGTELLLYNDTVGKGRATDKPSDTIRCTGKSWAYHIVLCKSARSLIALSSFYVLCVSTRKWREKQKRMKACRGPPVTCLFKLPIYSLFKCCELEINLQMLINDITACLMLDCLWVMMSITITATTSVNPLFWLALNWPLPLSQNWSQTRTSLPVRVIYKRAQVALRFEVNLLLLHLSAVQWSGDRTIQINKWEGNPALLFYDLM